jgi:hypothetical protein
MKFSLNPYTKKGKSGMVVYFYRSWALVLLLWAAQLAALQLDKNTVAILGNKEPVSLGYFKDILEKIKKDSVEAYIRRLDYNRNFPRQVLQIITDNYIMAREALKEGFHNDKGFRSRLQVNMARFFGEYVAKRLVREKKISLKDQFNPTVINNYLKKKYKLRIYIAGIDKKGVFKVKKQVSPDIKYYGKEFPKVQPVMQATYQKKIAQQHTIASYRHGKEVKINLRSLLDRLDPLTFAKFRRGTALVRHQIVLRMLTAELLAYDFKRISSGDPNVTEYFKRIEQMTLAERYRVMKGYSPATPYIAPNVKIPELPVTEKEIADYYQKHKRDFARPYSAEVFMICLDRNQDEVDEGDGLIAELEEMELPLKQSRRRLMVTRDRIGELGRLLGKNLTNKTRKAYQQERSKLAQQARDLKDKISELKKSVPRKKFEAFKAFMRDLNSRPNRVNGKVRKSSYLGEVKFGKKLRTYENIAFTVTPGNQSVLFDSREGFYSILFVKKKKNKLPGYKDEFTAKRINYRLQEIKRKEQLERLLIRERKRVLPDSAINHALLKKLE